MGTALADRGAEIAAEIETLQAELAEAERVAEEELQRIAGDIAVKAITQAAGSKRRRGVERALKQKRDRLAQLRDAAVGIERRAHEAVERAHENELKTAATKLDRALKARWSAAKNLARALRDVELAADEVGRHRPLVDEAATAYESVLRPGEPFRWPSGPDEPWEISEGTLAFLTDGPNQPQAAEEKERRERETTQARQDQEQARWIRGARSPSETRTRLGSVLDGIPSDSERAHRFREIAAEHAKHTEKQISEARERQKKRERGFPRVHEQRSRPPARISGQA